MKIGSVVTWAESNPVEAGGIVFVGGLVLLYMLGYFGGGSSSGYTSQQAYYSAVAADAQAGDALQATQIQANADTAQLLIASAANVQNNTTWANNQLAVTNSNNQAAMSLAPFQQNEDLISSLSSLASTPPTVVTSTKSSSGFFGIGGGSKTSQTVLPNPGAEAAASLLSDFVNNGMYPAH